MDRALSGAIIPGQNESGSNGNGGVLCIPPSSSITVAPLSNCLVSYPSDSLVRFTHMQRGSRCILLPQQTGQSKVSVLYIYIYIYIYSVSWRLEHSRWVHKTYIYINSMPTYIHGVLVVFREKQLELDKTSISSLPKGKTSQWVFWHWP